MPVPLHFTWLFSHRKYYAFQEYCKFRKQKTIAPNGRMDLERMWKETVVA
jgi:hypothetical protein